MINLLMITIGLVLLSIILAYCAYLHVNVNKTTINYMPESDETLCFDDFVIYSPRSFEVKESFSVKLNPAQLHLFRLLFLHTEKLAEHGIVFSDDEVSALNNKQVFEQIDKINKILGIKNLRKCK